MKFNRLNIVVLLLIIIFSCGEDNIVQPDEAQQIKLNEAYADSIIFMSTRALGSPYSPTMHIMSKDGTGIRALTNDGFSLVPQWSIDKNKIAFIDEHGTTNHEGTLCIMDSNGKNRVELSQENENVFYAKISPDMKTIAYVNLESDYDRKLKIMNVDGSDNKYLIEDDFITRFSWMPNSKSIVYSPNAVLKVYSLVNNKTTTILERPAGIWFPDVSPDGKKIVFTGQERNSVYSKYGIFEYDMTTHQVKELLILEDEISYNASYSKDGKYIVFDSQKYGQSPSFICIMNTDGSDVKKLTDDLGEDYGPSM